MKTDMKKHLFSLMLLCALCACGSSDDDEPKDMSYPEISDAGITANPIDCQQYHRGDVIPFQYVFKDNMELGAYNIEIHHNFDHHTHSTSSIECPMDAKKEAVKPWIYNHDFPIPSGKKSFTANIEIPIPADIDAGDYHFMIRLTDRAGWQQLRAVTIKVTE